MRIMMSAASSPTAPGIIRHLQKLGHDVIGHDSQPHFGDTIPNRFIRSPKVGAHYLPFLKSFGLVYDLYIPFLDEELYLFGFAGEPDNCMCSPEKTLLIFTSKVRQQRALREAGLPVAPEVEVIFKPDQGRGGKGVMPIAKTAGYVAQRLIRGTEYTIDVLTDMDGQFLFAVPRKRLVSNGVSVVGQIDMHQDMIGLAEDVVEKFKFCGPINIQAIREHGTGEIYITEVNARLSGSCMFTVMAGFDILDATLKLHRGERFTEPVTVREVTIRRHYVEEIV